MYIANYGTSAVRVTGVNKADNTTLFFENINGGMFQKFSVDSSVTAIKLTFSTPKGGTPITFSGGIDWGDYGAPNGVYGIWEGANGEYSFAGSNNMNQ